MNILLYEIDILTLRDLSTWLRLTNHDVSIANSYDHFLDLLELNDYDLVIFDFNQSNNYDSLHALGVHRALSVIETGDIKALENTCFVLYTNKLSKLSMIDLDNICLVEKTTNANLFFSKIASAMQLPESTAQQWSHLLHTKLTNHNYNVVELRPK